jgi:UDP-glucose 4-epimerase
MRVLITGAGGNLGRVLAPALEEKGHEPILLDNRELKTPYPFIQGDVRDSNTVKKAAEKVDAIVHAAALHGIHLAKYTPEDFWSLNVTGTHHVYEAALQQDISKVVFCSTMGVYGQSIPYREDAYSQVTEELPLLPIDTYGLSKRVGENISEYYQRKHGISTISLRLGMFVPEDFIRYGLRLLKGGVDDRDVAQAFILALENTDIAWDAFNIMSEVPFTETDEKELLSNPRAVLEKYYSGANEIFEQKKVNVEEIMGIWGPTYWPVEKARKELGYQPNYNFRGYLTALKENNYDYYPFAGLPWWGI